MLLQICCLIWLWRSQTHVSLTQTCAHLSHDSPRPATGSACHELDSSCRSHKLSSPAKFAQLWQQRTELHQKHQVWHRELLSFELRKVWGLAGLVFFKQPAQAELKMAVTQSALRAANEIVAACHQKLHTSRLSLLQCNRKLRSGLQWQAGS
jgi:hypothetical protein